MEGIERIAARPGNASPAEAGMRQWLGLGLGLALLALPTMLLGVDLTFLPMILPALSKRPANR